MLKPLLPDVAHPWACEPVSSETLLEKALVHSRVPEEEHELFRRPSRRMNGISRMGITACGQVTHLLLVQGRKWDFSLISPDNGQTCYSQGNTDN